MGLDSTRPANLTPNLDRVGGFGSHSPGQPRRLSTDRTDLRSTYRKLGLDHGPSLREEKHHEKGAGEKRLPTWGKQGRWPCLPQKQGAQEPPDNTQRAQYALEKILTRKFLTCRRLPPTQRYWDRPSFSQILVTCCHPRTTIEVRRSGFESCQC